MALLALVGTVEAQTEGNVPLPREPSISPDGSEIVFSWRGDLWKVAAAGGAAQRLTVHPAEETSSAWSPDGRAIAFASNRSGSVNLYVMDRDGADVRQATFSDRPIALADVGVDEAGETVLAFAALVEADVYRSPRPYMAPLSGGEPRRVHNAFGSNPQISPDGSKVLFERGGVSWLRRHYAGADSRDVWLYDRATLAFTRLTSRPGADGRPRWIDNESFVFASDREDRTLNLYRLRLGQDESQARRLTRYDDRDVEHFDVSADGRRLVFARWGRLHTLELSTPDAEPATLDLRAVEDADDRIEIKDVSRAVSQARLSPDGKTMAFVAFGDVYVRSMEAKSPTRRVTRDEARQRDIAWSADGLRLLFVSDHEGREAIYSAAVARTRGDVREAYAVAATRPTSRPAEPKPDPARFADAIAFTIERVTASPEGDREPDPSPDGRRLAFRRGSGSLMVMDLAGGETRRLLDGWSDALEWRWSPDSTRLAYVTEDENFNADIWIAPADGSSAAVNVTRHPNNDYAPRFSADGKALAFLSERSGDEYDVWSVWLDKSMEGKTPDELAAYFKEAGDAARKRKPPAAPTTRPSRVGATRPTEGEAPAGDDAATRPSEAGPSTAPATQPATAPATQPASASDAWSLDDAYLRLQRWTRLPRSETALELLPGGDRVVFKASFSGQPALYTVDRDAPEPRRIGGNVEVQEIALSGDRLIVVESGRASVLKLPDGAAEAVDIADRVVIDRQKQVEQRFLEAMRVVGDAYYDATMAGLDWAALTRQYLELARHARTAGEFDYVANRMLGELNGSHLGVDAPEPAIAAAQTVGRLGARHEPVEGGFRVVELLEGGPGERSPTPLKVDDVIVAIDGAGVQPGESLDARMLGRAGAETLLRVRRVIDGHEAEIDLLVVPQPYARIADLSYQAWQKRNARLVEEWSGGRLGYLHIQGMNTPSLEEFERDLYAAAHGRDGLVMDVRNNGGGSTADLVLASIMYPRHAYTRPRGMDRSVVDGYPQDRLYIQRYSGPINLLCNEKSFSNAEIFSHAFCTLKRGTLVGVETAGGVISTGSTRLVDGTTVRLPFRGWFLPDGTNMENHGARPDLPVPQRPEDEASGQDAQLRAAVDDLLRRLPAK